MVATIQLMLDWLAFLAFMRLSATLWYWIMQPAIPCSCKAPPCLPAWNTTWAVSASVHSLATMLQGMAIVDTGPSLLAQWLLWLSS